jgi:excisionase family DNA binding protein
VTCATSPRYLSKRQAAAIAGVSESTVKRWIRKGWLPARRLGPRLTRIDVRDLDKLMAAGQ